MRALLERGWKVSEGQRRALAEIRERHDLTGAAYAAEIIRQTPPGEDALGAVLRADAEWQRAREREIEEREERDANPSAPPREEPRRTYAAGAPERIGAALPLPAREITLPVVREPSPAPETDAETRKRRREVAEKMRAAGLARELWEPYLRDDPPEA